MQELEILRSENRRLKETVQRLEAAVADKHVPLSDDAVNGIAYTILLLVVVSGLGFWLGQMPH